MGSNPTRSLFLILLLSISIISPAIAFNPYDERYKDEMPSLCYEVEPCHNFTRLIDLHIIPRPLAWNETYAEWRNASLISATPSCIVCHYSHRILEEEYRWTYEPEAYAMSMIEHLLDPATNATSVMPAEEWIYYVANWTDDFRDHLREAYINLTLLFEEAEEAVREKVEELPPHEQIMLMIRTLPPWIRTLGLSVIGAFVILAIALIVHRLYKRFIEWRKWRKRYYEVPY